jgi:starvation-inducible DNA-binding protein
VWFAGSVVDDVAERAWALDGNTIGTLAEFVERARLAEHPGQCPPARAMLADHEAIIRLLGVALETGANTYQDTGTNDFLTGLMEQHEKMAQMLWAFMAGAAVSPDEVVDTSLLP